MIEDKDYKDVVVDNDAIVNTAAAELPAEPQNIPQGKEPEINPNPGYGENGETKPAIKTDLVEGESGTPVIENTTPKEQPEQIFNGEVVFNKEPIINGKKLTDYIDSEGGVTQEELENALAPIISALDNIKGVSSFEINASGHLIVNYDDGTNQDLGAIFSGNVNIDGNFTANSIIENMTTGYGYAPQEVTNLTLEPIYASICKNGNKITFVYFVKITRTGILSSNVLIARLFVPSSVGDKLYPFALSGVGEVIDAKEVCAFADYYTRVPQVMYMDRPYNTLLGIRINETTINNLTENVPYLLRYEATFLLSDNLIS